MEEVEKQIEVSKDGKEKERLIRRWDSLSSKLLQLEKLDRRPKKKEKRNEEVEIYWGDPKQPETLQSLGRLKVPKTKASRLYEEYGFELDDKNEKYTEKIFHALSKAPSNLSKVNTRRKGVDSYGSKG